MRNQNNSRDEWQKAIIERQHNLAPADITRTSQFRASGRSKWAPLPIVVRRSYIYVGVALLALGTAVRVTFDNFLLNVVGVAFGAVGLCVMLLAVRWTAK